MFNPYSMGSVSYGFIINSFTNDLTFFLSFISYSNYLSSFPSLFYSHLNFKSFNLKKNCLIGFVFISTNEGLFLS